MKNNTTKKDHQLLDKSVLGRNFVANNKNNPDYESAFSHKTEIKKRHGSRNQHRHKYFMIWLLKKFPKEFWKCQIKKYKYEKMKTKLYILDIAGGKGELSARICLCHNARVIMVDPRHTDICECFEKNVYKSLPKKWQERINKGKLKRSDFILRLVRSRFRQLPFNFPEKGGLIDNWELRNAIENSTLIIGFHADSATEAIVDVALRYRRPFVVVPCCVFPNRFRNRMIDDNKTESIVPVRSHDQFCRYLREKNSHFVQESLPFEGRNIGIWWDGIHRDDD